MSKKPVKKNVPPVKKDNSKIYMIVTLVAVCVVVGCIAVAIFSSPKEIYADIIIEGYGTVTVKLEPEHAPITVDNFVKLAKSGFYDGLSFHRIKSGFMMQGGDPKGDGTGGSPDKIKGEFAANGVDNPLTHRAGAISMARSDSPDSASSQFFIMHKANPDLDGYYAVFGYVVEGMEIVNEICANAKPADGSYMIQEDQRPIIQTVKIRKVYF